LSSTPDEVHRLPTGTCPCGCSLEEVEPSHTIRRQVYELVYSPIRITEYQLLVKKCPNCFRKISSDFPDDVKNTINFGPNIKTLVLYLHSELFTPYKKIVQLVHDFYGLKLSPATIETFISAASNSLETYENEVRVKLLESPILHADETGFRVKGIRWWLHSLSNEWFSYYDVSPKRGSEAIERIGLIPKYIGVLIHDFWQAYAKYRCIHAYCNAHIIRELQGIYEGFGQKWAKEMRILLEKMFRYVFRTEYQSEHKVQELIEEYDRLIMQGELENPPPLKEEGKRGKPKKTKGGNLVERMKKHKDEILRFLTTGGDIPFTNNQAERDIRMMKVQQKISGTFRTEDGAKQFVRIRGYVSTMRKHGQSVCEALKALAIAQPILISSLGR